MTTATEQLTLTIPVTVSKIDAIDFTSAEYAAFAKVLRGVLDSGVIQVKVDATLGTAEISIDTLKAGELLVRELSAAGFDVKSR